MKPDFLGIKHISVITIQTQCKIFLNLFNYLGTIVDATDVPKIHRANIFSQNFVVKFPALLLYSFVSFKPIYFDA